MSYISHYRRWHPDDDADREKMIEFYTGLFWNTLHDHPRGPALDAGCGTGLMLEYLTRTGFTPVAGFDAEPEMVRTCRERGYHVMHGQDGQAVRELGNEFQVISCLDVIEHLDSATAAALCGTFHAALAPGGVFICTVPNANSVVGERMRYIDPTHRTSFTECTLDYLLREAGFSDITIAPAEWPLKIVYKSWARFVSTLRLKVVRSWRRMELLAELGEEGRNIPLSLNLMAVARK
ncbi:hypothetical protein GMLC_03140 [Geomonas limicola]|uniref:Uncharacterized protein n=1 Tax=Geomonas limicola TaxID=2740186 RepID=A0A6V8N2G4_9BACT|nr:class I SAM-dependent methyltransferase [Geomonas limicola]GFO66735.1 hypothetical protein GMLC_03140 [Geomonas limicola]